MKKLLFSAVALVAFSSVSMGNTIEQNSTIYKQSNKIEVISTEIETIPYLEMLNAQENRDSGSCDRVRAVTTYQALQAGATAVEANYIAFSAWLTCVGGIFAII